MLPFKRLIKYKIIMKFKKEKKLFSREVIDSINVLLFLGFNLSLISILGFVWFNSSFNNIV